MDRIDTSKGQKGSGQHGYPIDFWDDEAAEAEETAFETACIWIACGVIISLAAFFFWY